MTSPWASGGHVVRRALRQMGQAPMVQVVTVLTIAVCMGLMTTMVLVWSNAHAVTQTWGIDVPLTVYLADGAEAQDAETIAQHLRAIDRVERVEVVSPEQAMVRVQEGLGGAPELLAGLEPELFPRSLEVYLHDDDQGQRAAALARRLSQDPRVEDAVVAGAWARRAQGLLDSLANMAAATAVLVAFACVTIVWSTIRLAVYARRSEIHILRLVGGTLGFVHGPFVVEGMLQGACGAALAVGLVAVGFEGLRPLLQDPFAAMFAEAQLGFLAAHHIAALIGFGGVLGLVGSRAAVARYVDA